MQATRSHHHLKLVTLITACLLISACGSSKKNFSMRLHSDPLGAYALMQVKYKGNEESDWIYLGPTPVNIDKRISMKGATSISLQVIRPGFYEQTKTWKAKDFLKEQKQQNKIIWTPNMVEQ